NTIESPNAPSIRLTSLPVFLDGKVKYILQTESSMHFIEHALRQLGMLLVVISISILAMAWVGSRWVADQALTPVEALSSTAEQISASPPKTRLILNAPSA